MNNEDFFRKLPEPIISNRLILRRPIIDDANKMTILANNKNIHNVLARLPYPYGQEIAIDFIENLARTAYQHAYAIITRTGDFIGVVGFHIKETNLELGYWFGEPYWGKGYGTEAVKAMLDAADVIGVPSAIYANAMSKNQASIHVLEKAGFIIIDERIDDCGQHKNVENTYLKRV